MLFIPAMAKLNFQQPLLQSPVSHDPSEIILICWLGSQETFIIIIFISAKYFCGKNIKNSIYLK